MTAARARRTRVWPTATLLVCIARAAGTAFAQGYKVATLLAGIEAIR
jgi:hypothetical protein